MHSSTSLLGRILMGIASEMLEILTKILKIIFNKNIFRVTLKKQRRITRALKNLSNSFMSKNNAHM